MIIVWTAEGEKRKLRKGIRDWILTIKSYVIPFELIYRRIIWKLKKKKNQAILKFYFYFYETNGHEETMQVSR